MPYSIFTTTKRKLCHKNFYRFGYDIITAVSNVSVMFGGARIGCSLCLTAVYLNLSA
jgi:hypothetical protein